MFLCLLVLSKTDHLASKFILHILSVMVNFSVLTADTKNLPLHSYLFNLIELFSDMPVVKCWMMNNCLLDLVSLVCAERKFLLL